MRKIVKIELQNEYNNISINNMVFDCGMPGVEINIGGNIDMSGGCDGETIFMDYNELQQFVNECESMLVFLAKVEEANEDG